MVWNNNEQDGSEGRVWKRQILPDCDYEVELGKKMNGRKEKSSVKSEANNGHKKLQMLEMNINTITEVN